MIDHKLLKKFTIKPSRYDKRDFRFKKPRVPTRETMDLRRSDIVENPNYIGTSVGKVIADSYQMQLMYYYPDKYVDLSSLFIFYNARYLEGVSAQDYSVSLRSGLRAVYYYGACDEKLWPYDLTKVDEKPSDAAYEDAKYRYITEYYSLYNINDAVDAISVNKPPIIGINIYEDFLGYNKDNYYVKHPKFGQLYYGLHTMVLVGYNIDEQYFIAKNVWGEEWGMVGYCHIPFDYYIKYVSESWAFTISDQVSSLI